MDTPAGHLVTVAATALAAALAVLVLTAPSAAAHAVLVGTQPARGATVSEPLDVVVLEFNEPVGFAQVQVTGPAGERVDEGPPAEQGRTVEQPLAPVLAQGTYTVTFRVTSDDGHPIEDTFDFDYEGPAGTGEPDGPPPAATDEPPLPDGDAEIRQEGAGVDAEALDVEETGDVDRGAPVLVTALLALVALAGAAVLAARRRGGSDDGNPDVPAAGGQAG